MKQMFVAACGVLVLSLAVGRAEPPPTRLRVTQSEAARAITAEGGRLIASYGSFAVYDVDSEAATRVVDLPGVEIRNDDRRILLHAGVIDTRSAGASKRARASDKTFAGKRLRLVHFAAPIRPEWCADLEAQGCQVVAYIPHNAYLVYADAPALARVRAGKRAAAFIDWEDDYRATDKVHPRARRQIVASKRGAGSATSLYTVQMVADASANVATLALVEQWKTGPLRRRNHVLNYLNAIAPLPAEAVDVLAEQPDVVSITPYVERRKFDERQDQIVAGNLVGTGPNGPGYLAWLTSKGFSQAQFDASGLVVDVTDSGIDDGTASPNHFGLYKSGDTGQTSRVAYNRLEGTSSSGSTIQGCDGHGNLNAHIIAGYNDLTGFPHADSSGYRYGLGVCPFVKVGSSVIFDPNNFTNPDYADLISRAYRDGARISSDSWGADTAGGYDVDAQAYDALVRDAQPSGSAEATAGNQEITIVFAAGNAGPSAGTVGSPGTAKNVITVGAAENVHSHATTNGGNSATGNDGCSTPDSEANSADDIASFSSRGPCSDARSKPEIVAPGTHITGGVAQDSPPPSPTGTGNDLACFDGTGVCALPGGGTAGSADNFFPQGQQFYSTSSGTSHSTPAVAGGCALIRQYFVNQAWTVPSPAMVKAYLVNSARYMTGTSANDDLWSNNQGMGGMNLGTAFDGVARVLRDQLSPDKFTASGQSRTLTGSVDDTGKPFRVTLSWTDAPGSTTGDAFNNDLDLVVTIDGTAYKGNVFSGAFSTAGGSADFRNNTESVFLPAGTAGSFVITVTAANINSDGVPNEAPALDQDFALVVYNGNEEDLAAVALDSTAITSENCGAGNGALDPDETVTVDFALKNVGNVDTTNVVATLQAADGVTLPSGPQAYGVLTAGGSAVTRAFTFTATGTCGSAISATLQLQDGASDLGTIVVPFTLGSTIDASNHYANTTVIAVPGSGTIGNASPYPSSLSVAGIEGAVGKVVVRLPSFSHTFPEDVDVLLVGPQGESTILMSAVGTGNEANNVDLTFDDDAASSLSSGPIISGTYRPTDLLGDTQVFDAPAPVGPYDVALSVFDGTDPNGTWSLFAVDGADQDAGVIALGWELTILSEIPFCCASNQPPIITAIPDQSGTISNLITFSVVARDLSDGDEITLSASNLPSWASFATVTNLAGVTNSFSGTPDVSGVSTVTFYAVDKDGVDTESVEITVSEPSGDCAVIISEYIEGSSNNKALEIFNGTSAAIDLAADNYIIEIYANGNVTPNSSISLSGTVAPGEVHVLANTAANATILSQADQTSGSVTFNGNDPVVLRSGGAAGPVVDALGQIGNAADYAKDTTLVRKSSVILGDTNTADAFDAVTEWDSFATDTSTDLGAHTMDCTTGGGGGTPPVLLPIGSKVVAESNTLTFAVSAVPTDGDTVTLSVSNAPAGSNFSSVDENGTFTWTNAAPVGVYTTTFYAVDADGADTEEIVITVQTPGAGGGSSGAVWINEIHYDNDGLDSGEGVELAGAAGTDLSTYEVYAYNGSNGKSYATNSTTILIDDEGCGFGAIWFPILGLQNGNPDGVALVKDGTNVLEFLSYEGTFTAADGPAAGLLSDDIGLTEGGTTPSGESLQLTGSGTNAAAFTWTGPAGASQGTLNAGQTIVPCGGGVMDTDGDGLPDDWELEYFGGITNADANTDSDGDTVPNHAEFTADTNPTNGLSFLFVNGISNTPAQVITFPSSTARVYRLQYTTNLALQAWMDATTNVAGESDGETSLVDTGTPAASSYRIHVEMP